jgi:DNA-binding transcriptional ArsR family regulator
MTWGARFTEDESSDILKGTALEIYRLILKTRKPLGIREIQRALNLSSPSVAQYHLSKLEHVGLLKKEAGNYVINKVVLENCVKITRFLVPRYLFYSVFAIVILFIEIIFLKPIVINREYFFYTSITIVFVLIFCYETVKVWVKGKL